MEQKEMLMEEGLPASDTDSYSDTERRSTGNRELSETLPVNPNLTESSYVSTGEFSPLVAIGRVVARSDIVAPLVLVGGIGLVTAKLFALPPDCVSGAFAGVQLAWETILIATTCLSLHIAWSSNATPVPGMPPRCWHCGAPTTDGVFGQDPREGRATKPRSSSISELQSRDTSSGPVFSAPSEEIAHDSTRRPLFSLPPSVGSPAPPPVTATPSSGIPFHVRGSPISAERKASSVLQSISSGDKDVSDERSPSRSGEGAEGFIPESPLEAEEEGGADEEIRRGSYNSISSWGSRQVPGHMVVYAEKPEKMTEKPNQPPKTETSVHSVSQSVRSVPLPLQDGLAPDWRVGSHIGQGTLGTVYRAVFLHSGEIAAMKKNESVNHFHATCPLCKEAEVLRSLNHPGIVALYDAKVVSYSLREGGCEEKSCMVFMEFGEMGNLRSFIREFGKLPDATAQAFTAQLVSAVAYIHAQEIIHRDLKPDNIVVDSGGRCKLCDFGEAHLMFESSSESGEDQAPDRSRRSTLFHGTPQYTAPEVLRGGGHRFVSDVWSLGATVYEMVSAVQPYEHLARQYRGRGTFALLFAIEQTNQPPILPQNNTASPACKQFLSQCLALDPRVRSRAHDLTRTEWIAGRDRPGPSPIVARSMSCRKMSVTETEMSTSVRG
eukprot:Hpha_TRINITY_DN5807_c0_g1::TRINITY_DN5807_c0_g1_i1::g.45493::m.45493